MRVSDKLAMSKVKLYRGIFYSIWLSKRGIGELLKNVMFRVAASAKRRIHKEEARARLPANS